MQSWSHFYNAKELKNSKAPELFRIHSFLWEAYEAAEAGNFQVAERLQSLFMSPYDEHPEDSSRCFQVSSKWYHQNIARKWYSKMIQDLPFVAYDTVEGFARIADIA